MEEKEDILKIRMLDHFTLSYGSTSISESDNRSYKLWNLMGFLIMNRNRPVPSSELIENLWQESENANASSSLKTAFNRLRQLLLPISSLTGDVIVSTRGAYQWNPNITCWIDVNEFEREVRLGMDGCLTTEERITHCQKAQDLYQAEFMPRQKDELWVMPTAAHLRTRYLDNAKLLWELLDSKDRYDEMQSCATKALSVDPLDENANCNLIRTLMKLGQDKEAMEHCKQAQKMLYHNLRVQPSKELSALHEELATKSRNLDLFNVDIYTKLAKKRANEGAFYCEYVVFEEIFQLERKRIERNHDTSHLCVLTVLQNQIIPSIEVLNVVMPQILSAISHSLRGGDVVTKCSGAQFLIMLPMAEYENAEKVMERIRSHYYRGHRKSMMQLYYEIHEIE